MVVPLKEWSLKHFDVLLVGVTLKISPNDYFKLKTRDEMNNVTMQ